MALAAVLHALVQSKRPCGLTTHVVPPVDTHKAVFDVDHSHQAGNFVGEWVTGIDEGIVTLGGKHKLHLHITQNLPNILINKQDKTRLQEKI